MSEPKLQQLRHNRSGDAGALLGAPPMVREDSGMFCRRHMSFQVPCFRIGGFLVTACTWPVSLFGGCWAPQARRQRAVLRRAWARGELGFEINTNEPLHRFALFGLRNCPFAQFLGWGGRGLHLDEDCSGIPQLS